MKQTLYICIAGCLILLGLSGILLVNFNEDVPATEPMQTTSSAPAAETTLETTTSAPTTQTTVETTTSAPTTETTQLPTTETTQTPTTETTQAPTTEEQTTAAPTTEPTIEVIATTAPTTAAPTTEPTTAAPTTQPTTPPTTQPTTETVTQPETTPPTTTPDEDISITAKSAFVYDSATGKTLYIKGDADAPVLPASLTKLFSSYVALQHLQPDTVVTVGKEVTLIDPDSSLAHIYRGQRLKVEMLIQGMLMQSGNDAAYALAAAVGRHIQEDPELPAEDALEAFVDEMNACAQQLGLTGSHFANPDGIHIEGHYTTLNDLMTISRLAMDTPVICKYASMVSADVMYESGEICSWRNTNFLLHSASPYYCEAACGLKTGATDDAGKCLIAAFKTENGYLLVGVLGCPDNDSRYEDALKLYSHFTGAQIRLPEKDS